MEKQEEYELRKLIKDTYRDKIDNYLNNYFFKYENNINFLIYYPLIYLENLFHTKPEKEARKYYKNFDKLSYDERINILNLFMITVEEDIFICSWFIREMLRRCLKIDSMNPINDAEFEKFKLHYSSIKLYYEDLIKCEDVMDMWTINKFSVNEIQDGSYEILEPTLKDKYPEKTIYYMGMDDIEKTSSEYEVILNLENYLHVKYSLIADIEELNFKKIEKDRDELASLYEKFDYNFLKLCYERVSIDINNMASQFSSSVISNIEELKLIIAALHYFSKINLYENLYNKFNSNYDIGNSIIEYKKDDFIKGLQRLTGVSYRSIDIFLEYYNFISSTRGTLREFPIIINETKIYFVPGLIILNDLQFSIVHGHYHKNINITNRTETVSQSLEERISNICKKYKNIHIAIRSPYNLEEQLYMGKELKGDIDVAIYDSISNTVLIIECKWKDNLFPMGIDFTKISDSLNKVYEKQLNKHKYYLELNERHLNELFLNTVDFPYYPTVEYLFVDKRAQLHVDNKHLVSIFVLNHLFEKYSSRGIVRLDQLVQDIKTLKTEVTYEKGINTNKVIIDNEVIYHNIFQTDCL